MRDAPRHFESQGDTSLAVDQVRSDCRSLATTAGAKRSQIVIGVDPRTVSVVPPEFDSIVTHGMDLLQFGAGSGDEISLRPVSLTQGARTVATQIFLGVFSDMTVIPGDSNAAVCFDVVNFSRIGQYQDSLSITLPGLRSQPR